MSMNGAVLSPLSFGVACENVELFKALSPFIGAQAHRFMPFNWDYVADVVNDVGLRYVSPRDLRDRHTVLSYIGRIRYHNDAPRPPLDRMDAIPHAREKCPRQPTPKHATVRCQNDNPLIEIDGVNYNEPLTPCDVATIRRERIAKNKPNQQTTNGEAVELVVLPMEIVFGHGNCRTYFPERLKEVCMPQPGVSRERAPREFIGWPPRRARRPMPVIPRILMLIRRRNLAAMFRRRQKNRARG